MSFYLGRYNCIESLGSGPLGETFRAKIYGVAGFEKQFAVKRIWAELCADPAFLERFVKSASAAASLGHDRICAIHEVGAQGAIYYVAADLARGIDLGQLVRGVKERDEAMTTDAVITLALDLLDALAYAHGRRDLSPNGVFHLGLGPGSVLISPEGDAKLLDVGLFTSLAVPGWATNERRAALAWVAPEVAAGGAADARADVFSVGALIHLALSGSPPFSGATADELAKRKAAGPPPPPACEGKLQAILQQALQPDPAARFPSVEALGESLRPLFTSKAARSRGDLAMLVRRLSTPAAAPLPAPQEPVLEDQPTKNTFAGVGPADGVPVQKPMLPGPATEKSRDAVDPAGPTEAMPLISPKVVSPPPLPPARPPEVPRRDPELVQPILPVLPRTERVAVLPEPPPSANRRRGLIVAVAGVGALLAAGAWILIGAEEPKPVAPPPMQKERPRPQAEQPAPSPAFFRAELPSPSPVKAGPPSLEVATEPAGAQLFVDGEPRGTAPLTLPLSPGQHHLVAMAEGSRILKQDVRVEGPLRLSLKLEPAQTKGTAGLKVRCKSKSELRIFIDGADSGLACPNETRVNLAPGEHTVGLYSPRTDKTVELKATVKDGNASTRIHVNY